MPPKPRQVKIEQRGMMQAMQALEQRSDEELEREQRHRAAAQAILGARASERYDAAAAREHFRRAISAARPQERMHIRRMADASLALAERRPDDLKAAVERLGQQAPSGRQLLLLRIMGLIAPSQGASFAKRARGFGILIGAVVLLILVGYALVELIALPLGGVGTGSGLLLGLLLVIAVLGVLVLVGRRRQKAAQAKARERVLPGGR